jgi:hypothetical protein
MICMKQSNAFFWPSLLGLLLLVSWSACTDPTAIGSDLLDEDRLGLDYTDTITLEVTSFLPDTVLTYSDNFAEQLSSFMFGDYTDPIFGQVTASIYAQPLLDRNRFGTTLVSVLPNYKNAVFDSIVLVLTLDTAAFYGKPAEPFGLEVYRVTEDMNASGRYYADASFATAPTPIGSATFFPRLDSVRVIDYATGIPDTISYPHLRIALNPALGLELLQLDSLDYLSDTSFIRIFKGLHIKPAGATDGLVAFNWQSLRPGIFMYYKDSANVQRQYQYEINELSARIASLRHDYTGSPAEPYINNTVLGETNLLLQGMAGFNVKIELPHIAALQGAIVNYAQLEIPLGTLPGDDPGKLLPAPDIYLRALNSDGRLVDITDVRFALNSRRQVFGGVLIQGTDGAPSFYRMNISSQLADMINGREPNVMYLQIWDKAQRGSRSILNGPKHPDNRMRVKVAFTKS